MAAPKNNQFWKQRSKHGRDKLFSTPEILWEAASEYFQWCDNNPLIEIEQSRRGASKKTPEVTKDGIEEQDTGLIEMPKMRAYTWDGLELYLNIESLRWYKTQESYKDFLQVIARIGKIIYTQKFTGAAAGFLNPNIIARDLGLKDRSDITSNNEHIITKVEIEEIKRDG